ncbi:L-threonine 3-dehydrogenase [Candidatus Micrarchaeota archaeon]|nr:L-threonine 3-dehydrogenase [Candidatus Micrarchaeota archaeon]MBU1939213.1 L-threonine 3-dehydrogenase [Candidatus Micrarchaeota archaeon]
MKAIIKAKPGTGAELKMVPIPKPKDDEVLVKILATSICGTDVHIYNWEGWVKDRIKTPQIMGHEFIGDIVEIGKDVTSVKVGDRITAETHIVCNKCDQCKTGNAHVCKETEIIGVDRDGSFAEYIAIPESNAWLTSKDVPLEVASVQEPLGNAVHAAMEFDAAGKTVAVFGCGPIGLFSIAILKKNGAAKVIALDKCDDRVALAKQMGADVTIRVGEGSAVDELKKHMNGTGINLALEMSGSPQAAHDILDTLAMGGEMVWFGLPNEDICIDIANKVVFRGIKMHGVIGRKMYDTWFKSRRLLNSGLDISPAITHKLAFEDWEKGINFMRDGKGAKIVLYPNPKDMK